MIYLHLYQRPFVSQTTGRQLPLGALRGGSCKTFWTVGEHLQTSANICRGGRIKSEGFIVSVETYLHWTQINFSLSPVKWGVGELLTQLPRQGLDCITAVAKIIKGGGGVERDI